MTSQERPFALWIGVITPLKNPLEVNDIGRAVPEMDFIVVGWPEDEGLLNRLVNTKPTNVKYVGTVSESVKNDMIQRCSIGLTTSSYEGFGWVPFEFLTKGKPVIGYPLRVFAEVYGDLVIYARSIPEFADRLKDLYARGFKVEINTEAVHELQRTYDFGKAARNIMTTLGSRSFVIFNRDAPIDSDWISGFHLVNWKLWKSISDEGAHLEIFSDGTKYSEEFGLIDRTTVISTTLLSLKRRANSLLYTRNPVLILGRKINSLILLFFEPLCFVSLYIRERTMRRDSYVIAEGQPQTFAAIILKFLFGVRVSALVHDARFYRHIAKLMFPYRVYNMVFARALRYVDHVMVVSNTIREEILAICPYPKKLTVIWTAA